MIGESNSTILMNSKSIYVINLEDGFASSDGSHITFAFNCMQLCHIGRGKNSMLELQEQSLVRDSFPRVVLLRHNCTVSECDPHSHLPLERRLPRAIRTYFSSPAILYIRRLSRLLLCHFLPGTSEWKRPKKYHFNTI